MPTKLKAILTNFSYVIGSNLLTVLVSSIVVLILPKVMGVEEYGYWQLYLFYLSYVGFLHLGWIDGIYLRYGGLDYNDLEKDTFFSQFILLMLYLTLLGALLLIGIPIFIRESSLKFVYTLLTLTMLFTNIRFLFIYILQMTNRLKESSYIISGDRLLYLVLLISFVVLGSRDSRVMVYADLIGRIVSLGYALYLCRDIALSPFSKFKLDLKEVFLNISVGINLMVSSIASMLIIGIVRMGIQKIWDIETFGKVSLTLSISNLMMTFINAVGLVIFPLLKRTNPDNLPKIYASLRNILMPLLFAILLFFYPLRMILNNWLPVYNDSLIFMALIFPMSVYEGKMALLINTYLKALRMEKTIFLVNLFVMCCSFVSTVFTALWMKNLTLTVLSIVVLLALRSIIAEMCLSRRISIDILTDIGFEILMTLLFITISWFLPIHTGFLAYLIVYIVYILLKLKDIKSVKQILISVSLPDNIENL